MSPCFGCSSPLIPSSGIDSVSGSTKRALLVERSTDATSAAFVILLIVLIICASALAMPSFSQSLHAKLAGLRAAFLRRFTRRSRKARRSSQANLENESGVECDDSECHLQSTTQISTGPSIPFHCREGSISTTNDTHRPGAEVRQVGESTASTGIHEHVITDSRQIPLPLNATQEVREQEIPRTSCARVVVRMSSMRKLPFDDQSAEASTSTAVPRPRLSIVPSASEEREYSGMLNADSRSQTPVNGTTAQESQVPLPRPGDQAESVVPTNSDMDRFPSTRKSPFDTAAEGSSTSRPAPQRPTINTAIATTAASTIPQAGSPSSLREQTQEPTSSPQRSNPSPFPASESEVYGSELDELPNYDDCGEAPPPLTPAHSLYMSSLTEPRPSASTASDVLTSQNRISVRPNRVSLPANPRAFLPQTWRGGPPPLPPLPPIPPSRSHQRGNSRALRTPISAISVTSVTSSLPPYPES